MYWLGDPQACIPKWEVSTVMPEKAVGQSRASACGVRRTRATIHTLEREFSTSPGDPKLFRAEKDPYLS